jgi:hypothetical protein
VIRHVVARTFVATVGEQEIDALEERTRALVQIPGVQAVTSGRNLGLVARSEGYEHVTTIDLDDESAFREFIAHPLHAASAAISGPLTARVVILDVTLDT